jgi:ubiquinone/menaquinone biosynthesis C-methylase UbiE
MSPVASGPWFNDIAAFLGPAYLRNAFTKGTEQEVEFLVDALHLEPPMRVLDAGCGPGRHSLALARRGFEVVGVDLSPDFIELARESVSAETSSATFVVGDLRDLDDDDEFDAVICLCQGGFGLLGGSDDEAVIERFARATKRDGGRVAISAFSSYFAVRHLEHERGETFDASTGVNHEVATLRDEHGQERELDLWTTCFTPRELRLLAERAGLTVDAVYGVTPGKYGAYPPSLDCPEHLLLARRLKP